MARAREDAPQVRVEHEVVLVAGRLGHRLQEADAGVVAQHVETPEAGDRLAHEALGIVLVADVGGDEHGAAALADERRASSSPSSAERCEATTVAPSSARRSTIARPMPRPAPVTIATLPARRLRASHGHL